MKTIFARGGAALARLYFQTFPIVAGKQFVWDKFVGPYILWRDLRLLGTTKFGAKVNVRFPDMIQARIYFLGVWEPAITRYISDRLSPGDTFIDIGSNIGYYSLLASQKVGPAGKVFAIEASPSIFATLCANLEMNGATNVQAENVAVLSEAGEVTIYLNGPENRGASTVVPLEAARRQAVPEAKVRGDRLQEIIPMADIVQARIIKIDVEGAEWFVVQGMKQLLPLLSAHTEVLVEINAQTLEDHGSSSKEFMEIFRRAGFEPFEIENSYALSEQWKAPAEPARKHLASSAFVQADIVFRRSATVDTASRPNLASAEAQ